MNIYKAFIIASVAVYCSACTTSTIPTAPNNQKINSAASKAELTFPIKVATWNIEHLAYPSDTGCKPRDSAEIVALREYAKSLDASIIALQEVASVDALRLIFPDDEWQFIFSGRADSQTYECRENGFTSSQQKVAFVLRNSIEVLNTSQFEQLALDLPGLRFGVAIKVKTSLGNIELLNVHLKSGCFVDNYSSSDSSACQIFSRQVPVLELWLRQHVDAGHPYIVLGDFNHRLSESSNHLGFNLQTLDPSLQLVTQSLAGCHPRYLVPIDHIWVGGLPTDDIEKSATMHFYGDMHEDAMLSDHCAVSVVLSLP
jgi:endonuclease/exonuclease/phosphatase family metal-dependent hydrolase